MTSPSLQLRYAPQNRCFGCGPANDQGLRIASYRDDTAPHDVTRLLCDWTPQPHHAAFVSAGDPADGILNGGICGALLDCHSNWTAAIHLLRTRGLDAPPCTVTAEFHVKLKRPTPLSQPLHLRAWTVQHGGDSVTVEADLTSGGKVTATCRGVFVAVREGHPAYHRW